MNQSLADWLFRSDAPEVMNHVELVHRLHFWRNMNQPTHIRMREMDHKDVEVIEKMINKLVDQKLIVRYYSEGRNLNNGGKFPDLHIFKKTGSLYHHHADDPFNMTGKAIPYDKDYSFMHSMVGMHSVNDKSVRVIEKDGKFMCQILNGDTWQWLHPDMILKLSFRTLVPYEVVLTPNQQEQWNNLSTNDHH